MPVDRRLSIGGVPLVQDYQSAGQEPDRYAGQTGTDPAALEAEALRAAAVKRLNQKRELQAHLLAYTTVNAFLVVIWAMTGAGFFWPAFPIFGWGIGLAFHYWDVYAPRPTEERIQAEMNRLRKNR